MLPSNPANIVGLQEDMVTCIEAAHQLKEILNSGSETNSRKVKSLAKRVNAYKNQIEAHIETGLGGELTQYHRPIVENLSNHSDNPDTCINE